MNTRNGVPSKMGIDMPFLSGNKGAINWTIGKLINIVLLLFVLVLVIYGMTTGGLNPLLEQVSGKFDEVLIMLNVKDDVAFQGCYLERISNLGGGNDFLKQIGMEGKDATFSVCRNARCNISIGGFGDYMTLDGKFYKKYGEEWIEYSSVFLWDVDFVKLRKEIYNAGVEILKKEGVQDIYEKGFTKQFVLYGDGSGPFDKPTQAIWANGVWRVSVDGEDFEVIRDDGDAIDKFVSGVSDAWDDKVYWKESPLMKPGETYIPGVDHGKGISGLISDMGDVDEIDLPNDADSLKWAFSLAKERLMKGSEISDDEFKKLQDAAVGMVNVGGRDFSIAVEKTDGFPIISFSSGKDRYGLKHSGEMKALSSIKFYIGGKMSDVRLESYPISLVWWDGAEWVDGGNEDYYRLPDNYFNEAYSGTLIKKFIESKCR